MLPLATRQSPAVRHFSLADRPVPCVSDWLKFVRRVGSFRPEQTGKRSGPACWWRESNSRMLPETTGGGP